MSSVWECTDVSVSKLCVERSESVRARHRKHPGSSCSATFKAKLCDFKVWIIQVWLFFYIYSFHFHSCWVVQFHLHIMLPLLNLCSLGYDLHRSNIIGIFEGDSYQSQECTPGHLRHRLVIRWWLFNWRIPFVFHTELAMKYLRWWFLVVSSIPKSKTVPLWLYAGDAAPVL